MNTMLPPNFCKQAVDFIDSFGLIYYGIGDLGECSNFINTFKHTTANIAALDVVGFIDSINALDLNVEQLDELLLTDKNRNIVLSFLNDVVAFKTAYLNLNKEPNFIEKLVGIKVLCQQLNYVNVRHILYHNCL